MRRHNLHRLLRFRGKYLNKLALFEQNFLLEGFINCHHRESRRKKFVILAVHELLVYLDMVIELICPSLPHVHILSALSGSKEMQYSRSVH